MFTGIISDIGILIARDASRLRIACGYEPNSLQEGGSIACDGCCLTMVSLLGRDGGGCDFEVDVSNETMAHTTLGSWQPGRRINLERPLSIGSEIGGHLLTGHVDGLARIEARASDGESIRLRLA